MLGKKETLWMAYLDGQLSAAESAEFDRSLTPDERVRLVSELRFESSLSESLGVAAPCPDELWNRVLSDVNRASGMPARWMRRTVPVSVVAAAAAVLLVSAWAVHTLGARPAFLSSTARTVSELTQQAELSSADMDAVESFMQQYGVQLNLDKLSDEEAAHGHHDSFELLGARHDMFKGEPVVSLLFECCNQPSKVVLAKQGSPAADAIGQGIADGRVQASRPIGAYVAAVVSYHRSDGMLDVLHAV